MDAEAPIMPVFRYFGWVGSFLLATLLAANWCLPAPIATHGGVPLDQKIKIRIHTDHKWPERVVLDDAPRTTVAHDAKADSETNVAGSETAILAERRPFEAFAEMAPPFRTAAVPELFHSSKMKCPFRVISGPRRAQPRRPVYPL